LYSCFAKVHATVAFPIVELQYHRPALSYARLLPMQRSFVQDRLHQGVDISGKILQDLWVAVAVDAVAVILQVVMKGCTVVHPADHPPSVTFLFPLFVAIHRI
jgi:hypothetical protein